MLMVALPANPDAFGRQAAKGSLYVEYQIPSNTLIQNKGNGWAMIQGPSSVGGRNAARSGSRSLKCRRSETSK
jgi:hypothetical protein